MQVATPAEIYEAPAAQVLHEAHREIEFLTLSKDALRFKTHVSQAYADLIYNGLWFTPLRQALNAFVDTVQERVTGAVRLKLFKGDCRVAGRKSPYALDASESTGEGAAGACPEMAASRA